MSRTNFSTKFCVWFFKKNIYHFGSRKTVPGKNAPGKMLLGKLSKIAPPLQENCLPWMFFVNFFLSLVFLFMRIFVHKKNLFIYYKFYYEFYYKFVYSICLPYFFLSAYFWFPSMVYNVYRSYMRDQQCWASLPGYTIFL